MRYAWRGTKSNRVYHYLPGRPDGRTLCGLMVLPEEGDQTGDERPEDRRLCYRCERLRS